MLIEIIMLCLLAGAIAGLLAGLLGIGGGVVLVPFLIWLFTWQGFTASNIMIMAIATSLATIIITSTASVLTHHRLGSVVWEVVIRLAPGIFVGAIVGALIADFLPAQTLRSIFAVFMLYVGLDMAVQIKRQAKAVAQTPLLYTAAGGLIGVLSAILGIGGGTLTVPFLVKCKLDMRNAVAISSACGVPIAVTGTLSYAVLGWNKPGLPEASLGYVYLPAFFAIVLMSMLFAPLGAKLAHKLRAATLKRYFSIVVFAVAVKLLW